MSDVISGHLQFWQNEAKKLNPFRDLLTEQDKVPLPFGRVHHSRQVLPTADKETAPSILWFAAIQGIKRNQDLADLPPKDCFVAAEAVEGAVGQNGKTQIAPREFSVWTRMGCNRIRHVARLRFRRDAVWRRTIVEMVRVRKASIDNFTRGWVNSAGLSNRVR